MYLHYNLDLTHSYNVIVLYALKKFFFILTITQFSSKVVCYIHATNINKIVSELQIDLTIQSLIEGMVKLKYYYIFIS